MRPLILILMLKWLIKNTQFCFNNPVLMPSLPCLLHTIMFFLYVHSIIHPLVTFFLYVRPDDASQKEKSYKFLKFWCNETNFRVEGPKLSIASIFKRANNLELNDILYMNINLCVIAKKKVVIIIEHGCHPISLLYPTTPFHSHSFINIITFFTPRNTLQK